MVAISNGANEVSDLQLGLYDVIGRNERAVIKNKSGHQANVW